MGPACEQDALVAVLRTVTGVAVRDRNRETSPVCSCGSVVWLKPRPYYNPTCPDILKASPPLFPESFQLAAKMMAMKGLSRRENWLDPLASLVLLLEMKVGAPNKKLKG